MEFIKNDTLLHHICQVQIKSVDNIVSINEFSSIYSTPSKFSLTGNSRNTDSGNLHNKNLSLFYPGLSQQDFDKFHELIKGNYQVMVKLDNNDIYEIASLSLPMLCSTAYTKKGHVLTFNSTSPLPIKYRNTQLSEGITIDGFNYDFNFYLG